MKNYIDDITIEDIPEKYQDIVKEIGLSNFLRLSFLLGGINWSVPTQRTLTKDIRDKKIVQDLENFTAKEIATKYKLTENHIYKLASEYRKKYKIKKINKNHDNIIELQIDIFDVLSNISKK